MLRISVRTDRLNIAKDLCNIDTWNVPGLKTAGKLAIVEMDRWLVQQRKHRAETGGANSLEQYDRSRQRSYYDDDEIELAQKRTIFTIFTSQQSSNLPSIQAYLGAINQLHNFSFF